jgi:hypothetical protein
MTTKGFMKNNFDNFIIKKMPNFIAANYQKLIETASPREKVERAVYTYNIGLRTLTIILVSQYLFKHRLKVCDPYLDSLLSEKFPRLTIDAWKQLFFTILKVYEGKQDLFFMPEIYDFYWDKSTTPHSRRTEVELPFDRLTQINVELNANQLPYDNDWEELARESRSLLRQVLEKFKFIGEYEFIRVIDYNEKIYTYKLHKGLHTSERTTQLPTGTAFNRCHYYIKNTSGNFLHLHPLLVFWEESKNTNDESISDTGIYDKFIYNYPQYILTNLGESVPFDNLFKSFIALIFDTIEEKKRIQLRTEKLTWIQLQDICKDITKSRMATVRKKFNTDLYLQRKKCQTTFKKFLNSDKRCFILIGKSGVGKSNFLLFLNDEVQKQHNNVCMLLYDGANLSVEPSITSIISQDFDNRLVLEEHNIEEIWREIAKIHNIEIKTVVLCVDAINENAKAKKLLRQLDELVQGPWPWLKIVVSSRPETWKEIQKGVKLAKGFYYQESGKEGMGVELEPFSYSKEMKEFSYQELPLAYAKYKERFNIQTDFNKLPIHLRKTLQEPLNLWLVSKTYSNDSIPKNIQTSELVEKYIIALCKNGILTDQDLSLLENRLVPIMTQEGDYTNSLSIADIDSAGKGLYELVYSDQVLSNGRRLNQSFINLLNAEILTRQKDGRNQNISFKYERFYEYFVGEELIKKSKNLPDQAKFFSSLIDQVKETPFLWGAIHYALLNLIDQNSNTIKKLAKLKNRESANMITSVLVQASSEKDTLVEEIIRELLKTNNPITSDTALRVAFDTLDTETLLLGLLSKKQSVNNQTIQYIYTLNKTNPESCLDILEKLLKRIRIYGVFPNIPIIKTMIMLQIILIVQYIEKDNENKKRYYTILEDFIQKMLYAGNRNLLGKLAREFSMFLTLRVFQQLITSFKHLGLESGVEQWENIFSISEEKRSAILQLIPFLDYRYGTYEKLEQLIPKIRSINNHMSDQLLANALNVRGSKYPNKTIPLIKQIYEADKMGAIYLWEKCMTYRDNIDTSWLDIQKEFVIGFFKEHVFNKNTFPNIEFNVEDSLPAYPLMCYASIWNRVNPNKEVDLIEQYLRKAMEEKNEVFILHIIDGFGNRRFDLPDYRAPLRSLIPLFENIQENTEIRNHLADTLASLSTLHPEQISHFLFETQAPRIFREQVKQLSYNENPVTMLRRAPLFFRDALLQMPPDAIEMVVDTMSQAANQKKLSKALEIVLRTLINELGGGDIFLQMKKAQAHD